MRRPFRILLLVAVMLSCFAVGVFRLYDIPADWYGDISIVHEYVTAILSGNFLWQYSLSAGPLYHYLIAPGILLIGHSYLAYKLMSVVVGMVGVGTIYLLASEFVGQNWAYLTAFVTGTSFWYVAWERTGNSQILIVPVTALSIWCAMRWYKTGRTRFALWGTFVSLLGLFIYPQTWVLPILFVILTLSEHKKLSYRRDWPWVIGIMLVVGVLWFVAIFRSGSDVGSGYIGSKIWPAFTHSPVETMRTFIAYFVKTMLMFTVKGDVLFRVNVPNSPQLDAVSGILFILGIFRYVVKRDWKPFFFLWFPIIFLILPSISPGIPPAEVPSSGRTIAVVPFVSVLVTSGIVLLFNFFKKWQKAAVTGAMCVVLVIVSLNLYKYFVLYPRVLPDGNRPFARIISQFVDTVPQKTPVVMSSCCWGAWGQPEPKAVYYQLREETGRSGLLTTHTVTCADIPTTSDFIVIGDPVRTGWVKPLLSCANNGQFAIRRDRSGAAIFASLYIPRSPE